MTRGRVRRPLPSWGCLLWWWRPGRSAAGPECWAWLPGGALHEHCEPRWWAEGRSEATREENAVRTNCCDVASDAAWSVSFPHKLISTQIFFNLTHIFWGFFPPDGGRSTMVVFSCVVTHLFLGSIRHQRVLALWVNVNENQVTLLDGHQPKTHNPKLKVRKQNPSHLTSSKMKNHCRNTCACQVNTDYLFISTKSKSTSDRNISSHVIWYWPVWAGRQLILI